MLSGGSTARPTGDVGLIIRMSARRSRRLVVLLTATLSCFGGCSSEKRPAPDEAARIEASFGRYKEAVLLKNSSAVASVVSEGSLRHYDRLREIALNGEPKELEGLQWVDRMQVLMFRQLLVASELDAMSSREVVAFVFEKNMLGKDLERTSTFDKLRIEGEVATARHIVRGVPAGGPMREVWFRWAKRPDGDWDIDLQQAIGVIQGQFDDSHRVDFPELSEEELAHSIVEVFTQQKLRPDHFRPMMAVAADSPSKRPTLSLTASAEDFPPLGSRPSVELVEPGDPPRRKLRLKLTRGATQRLEITTTTDMQSEVGGRRRPSTRMPSLTYELTARTQSVDRAGKARLELEVVDVRVDADQPAPTQMAAQLKDVALSLRGTRSRVCTDARGFIDDFEREPVSPTVATGDQMGKVLESSISRIQPLLPAEEVGRGAKWVVRETVEEAEVTTVRASVYEVAEIAGSRVDLVGRIEQAAPAGYQSRGTIEATLDLGNPFPTGARSRSALTMQIDGPNRDGTAGPTTLSMDTEVVVKSSNREAP